MPKPVRVSSGLVSVVPKVLGASALIALSVSRAIAGPADNGQLEEVVVTAQFRQQNLQQTPIAITAVNAAMLEQRNQSDITQVAAQAPNVTLAQNGAAFGSSMSAYIRGVGQTDFNLALEPGVGIYVDDVYYSTVTGSILDLVDLDRVEVMRGPQGTLAGKNSIGGAIKLFSKKPNGDDTGYIELTKGSLNRVDARGAADFTLIKDTLFARASFSSKHHDGYVTAVDYACTHPGSNLPTHDSGDGCTTGHQGDQAYDAARLELRWLASDSIEVNLSGDVTNDKSGVPATTLLNIAPGLGTLTYTKGVNGQPVFFSTNFIPYGKYSTDPNHPNNPYLSYATFTSNACSVVFGCDPYAPISVPPINHLNSSGFSANIQWKLADNMTLTSISAYRTLWNQFAEQTDSSPIGVQILLQMQRHKQFTQELRLSGKFANVDYTVGGFYLDGNGGLNARVGLPWVGFDFIHGPDSTPAQTKAAFANGEWHLTDQLSLDGGVRYSDEKKDYTYYRHNGDGTTITPASPWNGLVMNVNGSSAHFAGTHTDYRLALQYQFNPDMMGYVQTATGYKGGGVDPRPFVPYQDQSFAPETMTAYEAGFKSYLFDRTIRLNAAVFYNNYKDIQLTLNSCPDPSSPPGTPAPPCALPANVGSAHIKGVELEIEAHPMGGLELDASASYLNFEYYQLAGGPTLGITKGMITPYTPTKKASVGIQYEIPVGEGSLTPRLDVNYQGSEFTNPINDPVWGQIAAYTVSNAHLTWRDGSGKWQTQLNVTNLTDKLYYLSLFGGNTGAGYLSGTPAMPREWSISVKRNFN